MKFPRTAVSDWMWAGGPFRRFLVSLAVTAVIAAIAYLVRYPLTPAMVSLFIGWDLGAWFMDRVYVDRLTRRAVVAG